MIPIQMLNANVIENKTASRGANKAAVKRATAIASMTQDIFHSVFVVMAA